MYDNGNLTGRLLQNLTVVVSHAWRSDTFPGWNRTNETPSFNRLYYIERGEGTVWINGIAYEPKPGQLMIMPAGTTQTTETSRDNPYTRYFCHFDAHIGEWPLFPTPGKLYICDPPDPDVVRELFADMIERFQSNQFLSSLRIHATLLNLIALCLEAGGYLNFMSEFMLNNDKEKLAHVLEYIEQRLGEPLSVEELADLIHLHPNYFIAYFKKFMGIPPMQYVQLKRMEFARTQLSHSDASISDIAEQTGMDLPHFSKYFKKATGLSPSAYRRGTK